MRIPGRYYTDETGRYRAEPLGDGMEIWSTDEEKHLKELGLSPSRNSPDRLLKLIHHFMNNGTIWAVTEGDVPVRVSKELARKVRRLTRSGDLGWILDRPALPSERQNSTRDKDLGPYERELFYFGVRFRDRLMLPRTDQVVGSNRMLSSVDLDLWTGLGIDESSGNPEEQDVDNEWGFPDFDARGHSMFADFRRHLADDRCWEHLNLVDEAFQAYVSVCGYVDQQIQSEIRRLLPDLAIDDVIVMSLSIIANIYKPGTGGDWIEFDYATVETQRGWAVELGSWRVGSEPSSGQLDAIIAAHRGLVKQTSKWDTVQQLHDAQQLALRSIDKFRASLEPNSRLRRLIIRGQCVECI